MFSENFTKIDGQSTFSEIEDILLSQSRDNYSQMSPADFFRIQDLYDQIKELMLQSVVSRSIKEKLLLLNSLNQAFISDKLEFIPLMLDFKISQMT